MLDVKLPFGHMVILGQIGLPFWALVEEKSGIPVRPYSNPIIGNISQRKSIHWSLNNQSRLGKLIRQCDISRNHSFLTPSFFFEIFAIRSRTVVEAFQIHKNVPNSNIYSRLMKKHMPSLVEKIAKNDSSMLETKNRFIAIISERKPFKVYVANKVRSNKAGCKQSRSGRGRKTTEGIHIKLKKYRIS